MLKHLPIILASKSPRRQELLTLMGLNFKVELKDVDESYPEELSPAAIAVYISEKKAKAFSADKNEIIITADTIVALNGEILGKPNDKAHAQEMLRKLSGQKHEVFTGVTIVKGNKIESFFDSTVVYCRIVTEQEINFYIDNYHPFDKAGSYGVQDWWGNTVVQRIEGSYTNVMGLPTEKLYRALENLVGL
ncbi:septum formation protein Maf [Pedobacter frigidisoli]|uniref:dTTP/UTP pyrophosphatase n=1 Tax=Pedobacter frigidisoli TaxID=2530455 RepID=A0A4R0P005_9SPHI|nr:Maf family protein [Pedobacter frigidisoli]TCD08519.1 septum formation protein Maf [Pedobacter frigidisoli]